MRSSTLYRLLIENIGGVLPENADLESTRDIKEVPASYFSESLARIIYEYLITPAVFVRYAYDEFNDQVFPEGKDGDAKRNEEKKGWLNKYSIIVLCVLKVKYKTVWQML